MAYHGVVMVLATAHVVVVATLIAAAAGYLARRDHASYPAALARAATAFAATLMLAAAVTGALVALTGRS